MSFVLVAMKTWRFKTFIIIKLLLALSIPVLGYYLADNLSRLKFVTMDSWSCKLLLNRYQHVNVRDSLLRKVVNLCSREGTSCIDNRFKINYLKRNLWTFNCTQTWEYLRAPRPLVALASYQGSGNTWTRELIETATGLHSGSVYKDWNFVGSKLCPARGKVFIIKTHSRSNATGHPDCLKMGVLQLNYSKAIYILRNPYHTLLAEFNRKNAQKPPHKTFFNRGEGVAPSRVFKNGKWNKYLKYRANTWGHKAAFWLAKFDRPVHVLVYERLKENTVSEVYNLMKFLNISVTFNSLYCLSSNTTGNYHRVKPKWMTIEKLYSKKMRKMVNTVIKDVNAKVGLRRNVTDVLNSYLLKDD
ncbi:WSC domain-containing protein 1-like [Mercenaria mercenaria]|uniref:WSC domain-containing protein 1-like n=1 Tax=Mercenaria mercenaria TaxID=6596 RepID=UPI00234EF8F7|nr:WSC domain-containing protein 1-like [Mercenaria mercenaria]